MAESHIFTVNRPGEAAVSEPVYALIPAAGLGARMGADKNKVLLDVAGKSVLRRTLEAFEALPEVTGIWLVGRAEESDGLRQDCADWGISKLVETLAGGATRQLSVHLGLKALAAHALTDGRALVLIHDAARCLVDARVIRNCIAGVRRYGACVAAIPVKDTIKRADAAGFVHETLERARLWQIQTPQAFYFDDIFYAYESAARDGFSGTDDASLAERVGQRVALVEGSYRNIKLTTAEDLLVAEAFLAGKSVAGGGEMRR